MKTKILIAALLFLTASSCTEKEKKELTQEATDEKKERTTQYSEEESKNGNITIGRLEEREFSNIIEATGKIEVPPKYVATVSTPVGGFVEELLIYPGDYVKKGDVIARLQHPDYIMLQQKFMEAMHEVEYLEQEFKRQGELSVENAASLKKLQKAKADYWKSVANYKSLKAQLEMLGIDPNSLKNENFVSSIQIKAPIDGYITELNANRGKYVAQNEFIYEIMDIRYMHAHIKVYEKDVSKIAAGQKITIELLNNPDKTYISEVLRLGQKIQDEERAITVHCKISNKDGFLKPGMYVNAKIQYNSHQAYIIPSSGMAQMKDKFYVFMKTSDGYRNVEVKRGGVMGEWVEIIDPPSVLLENDIVTAGAYYLMAEMEEE